MMLVPFALDCFKLQALVRRELTDAAPDVIDDIYPCPRCGQLTALYGIVKGRRVLYCFNCDKIFDFSTGEELHKIVG